ncbi:TolC family protein [Chromobacterium haemolyticum]|nr:TolC family protein [Chromobacterium haemolyticum]
MKPFPATLALAGALMLSACAQMDAVKPASQLKTPPALNAPWAGMPSADWWRQWRDPQLEQLIRLALQDNPGLRAAEARLRQAQALSEVSAAAAQPQINAQWQSTRQLHAEKNLVPPAGHGNYDWQTRAAVNLSYDLDAWGRERQALSASLSDAQMAAADARLSALNLETAVIRAYLQLAEQYQQKDLAVAALQQQQALLDLSLRRKAAGLTAQPEVEQQRGKLPAARAQLEQIDERIATLGNQLAALSGQTPDTQNRPRRPTLRLDQPLDPLAAVPAQLLGPPAGPERATLASRGRGRAHQGRARRLLPQHQHQRLRRLSGNRFCRSVVSCRCFARLRAGDQPADIRRRPPARPIARPNRRLRPGGGKLQRRLDQRLERNRQRHRPRPLRGPAEPAGRSGARRRQPRAGTGRAGLPRRTQRSERGATAAAERTIRPAKACAGPSPAPGQLRRVDGRAGRRH